MYIYINIYIYIYIYMYRRGCLNGQRPILPGGVLTRAQPWLPKPCVGGRSMRVTSCYFQHTWARRRSG